MFGEEDDNERCVRAGRYGASGAASDYIVQTKASGTSSANDGDDHCLRCRKKIHFNSNSFTERALLTDQSMSWNHP